MSIKADGWVRVYGPVVLLMALIAYVGMYVPWPNLAGQDDVARITSNPVADASLRGLFVRMHGVGVSTSAATALLAVVALAVAIVGMTSAPLSPFGWSHHWVWVVPLMVHREHRAYVLGSHSSMAALWVFWATFAGWIESSRGDTPETGLLSVRHGGAWDVVIPAICLAGFAIVLVGTAGGCAGARATRRAPRPVRCCTR